jgi:hypothetical protein
MEKWRAELGGGREFKVGINLRFSAMPEKCLDWAICDGYDVRQRQPSDYPTFVNLSDSAYNQYCSCYADIPIFGAWPRNPIDDLRAGESLSW